MVRRMRLEQWWRREGGSDDASLGALRREVCVVVYVRVSLKETKKAK